MGDFIDKHYKRVLIAIFGLLIIIIQILLPDLIPDAINKTIASTSLDQKGYIFILNAILSLWQIGGFGLFLGGIFSMFFK